MRKRSTMIVRPAAHPHGFGHHSCKLGEHKAGEHLGREAARYEQVLRETARGTGELYEGPALFAAETTRQGRGRLLAWGYEAYDQHYQVAHPALGSGRYDVGPISHFVGRKVASNRNLAGVMQLRNQTYPPSCLPGGSFSSKYGQLRATMPRISSSTVAVLS